MCFSESGGKNLKSVWWDDKVKYAVRRKEYAWKKLAVSDVEAKERYMEAHREEKKRLKGVYISEEKVNE